MFEANFSQQAEVDFDGSFYRDRLAVLLARGELPLRHGFHGLFIETQAKALHYLDVGRLARRIDLHIKHDRSLMLGLARFFRIFGLSLREQHGSRNAAAYAEHVAADTAAGTRAV